MIKLFTDILEYIKINYLNIFYQSQKRGSKLTFSVVDIQGRVLQNYTVADVSDETYIIPVYDLTTGIYVLEVRENGQLLKSEQFIKQ